MCLYIINQKAHWVLIWSWESLCFACIFALFLTPSSRGSSTLINLIEGEPANLNFTYPCDSTDVTLQHGYQTPFYRSTSSEPLLTPDQEGRYNIVENNNSGSGGNCSLHLTINHVNRIDAGTFICQVYKDGQLLPEYPRIGLDVDYPPGKASCELTNDYTFEDWSALSCTAAVGTLPGQIGCFQDSVVSPPVLNPVETDSVLRHIFWVRHTHPVFCCSFRSDHPAELCDCRDFAKVPHESGLSDTNAEPCPVTTPLQHSSPLQSTTTINSSTSTTKATTKETRSHMSFHWTSGMAIGLFFVILILCVFLVRYYRAFKKQVRLKSNSTGLVEFHRLEEKIWTVNLTQQ